MVRLFTRKYKIKIILTCFVLPLLILSMGGKGYAAEPTLVYLPVSQLFTNQLGYRISMSEQNMGYILERQDPGTPMPDGSVGDQYILATHVSRTVKIGPIVFPVPGVYYYELRPTPLPNEPNSWAVRVSDTYTIAAYVRNDQTYTLVIMNSDGDKVEEMSYVYSQFRPLGENDKPGTKISDADRALIERIGLDGVGATVVPVIPADNVDEVVEEITTNQIADTPQTGDDRNLTIWMLLAALSLIGILTYIFPAVYKRE